MSELTPLEKLQPCLLDRLTDDDPKNPNESRTQRIVSVQKYKRGVLRDLEWLFNAAAHLPEEGARKFRLSSFPDACKSVVNFGTRQLCGIFAPEMRELENQLADAIRLFEPRIIRNSLRIKASMERNMIMIELQGELWANPLPEQLFIKTTIDLETGQCFLGDRSNG